MSNWVVKSETKKSQADDEGRFFGIFKPSVHTSVGLFNFCAILINIIRGRRKQIECCAGKEKCNLAK